MKALLSYVWQRRWCRSLLWVALVFGLACLHPFVRQSIFGPKIDDMPWCVWEGRVRAQAQRGDPKPWFYQMLEKIGLLGADDWGISLESQAALPVYVHLADDNDPRVRRLALQMLGRHGNLPDATAEVLPILQRRLKDDDPRCRLHAAFGVWRATRDSELRHIALALVDHKDTEVRYVAVGLLCEMASQVPETFEPLAKLTEDRDLNTRFLAMYAMRSFGKRAIPVFRDGMKDSDSRIRCTAIIALATLRKDAAELIPDLLALRNDPNASVRESIAEVLPLIDPERFPPPEKAGK